MNRSELIQLENFLLIGNEIYFCKATLLGAEVGPLEREAFKLTNNLVSLEIPN